MHKKSNISENRKEDMILYLVSEVTAAQMLSEVSKSEADRGSHKFSTRFLRRQKNLIAAVDKENNCSFRRRLRSGAAAALIVLTLGVTATAGAAVLFQQRPADETELNWGLDSYSFVLEPLELENESLYTYKAQERRIITVATAESDEYKAREEWSRFLDEYEMTDAFDQALKDADNRAKSGNDDAFGQAAIYEMYGAYDDYSINVLERIANKYDVSLLLPPVYFVTQEQCIDFEAQCDFLKDRDSFSIDYGYKFEDGSLHCEFVVELEGYRGFFGGSMTAVKKGSFYPFSASFFDEGEPFTETGYITSSGSYVDIGATDRYAWVFYDGEDTCLCVRIDCYYPLYARGMKANLKAAKCLADLIDFSDL